MRKKMKSVVAMVLSFALTGAVLAGCGESRQPRQDTQQSIPTNILEETQQNPAAEEAETAEKPTQTAGGCEDNFTVDFLKLDADGVLATNGINH